MKKIALYFIFYLPILLFSQDSSTTVSPKKTEIFLRAKALGFVIIEDVWVRSFSIGTELRYIKKYSFVIDVVHFRWRYEEEVHDLSDPDQYSEYSQYDARNYIAMELRYFPIPFERKPYFKPYINGFSKIGNRNLKCQDKYPLNDGDVIKLNSMFYDLGASIGFHQGQYLGIDCSVGAAYRNENMNKEFYHANASSTFANNINSKGWNFNIRVNFYWNFSEE